MRIKSTVEKGVTEKVTGRVTKNVRRELESHKLLEQLLPEQKLTFVVDVDETMVQTHYNSREESSKQKDLESSSLPDYLTYQMQHSYPTSLLAGQSIEKLHNLGQGVGFVSKASFPTLIRLKMLGLDFNKIDFAGFGNFNECLNARDIEYAKECLSIEGKEVDSLEKLFRVLEEKHDIQIVTEDFSQEKWRTVRKLREGTNEQVKELLNRPIIAIGNQGDDCAIEYPNGGLGIKLESSFRAKAGFTNSLGRAFCYAATTLSNNPVGRQIIDQIQSNHPVREDTDRTSVPMHSIHTLNNAEAKSTWKEIQAKGSLLKQ